MSIHYFNEFIQNFYSIPKTYNRPTIRCNPLDCFSTETESMETFVNLIKNSELGIYSSKNV